MNSNRWIERYFRKIAAAILPSLEGAERILDVGCGDGSLARWANPTGRYFGVDIELRPGGAAPDEMEAVRADATNLPFADESFDLVLAKDSLHHVEAPPSVMAEISRVTAPEGRVVVVESNRWNPIGYFHLVLGKDHDHWTRGRLRQLVEPWMDDAQWSTMETHVYPVSGRAFDIPIRLYEFVMERTPLLNRLCSYFVVAGNRRRG